MAAWASGSRIFSCRCFDNTGCGRDGVAVLLAPIKRIDAIAVSAARPACGMADECKHTVRLVVCTAFAAARMSPWLAAHRRRLWVYPLQIAGIVPPEGIVARYRKQWHGSCMIQQKNFMYKGRLACQKHHWRLVA